MKYLRLTLLFLLMAVSVRAVPLIPGFLKQGNLLVGRYGDTVLVLSSATDTLMFLVPGAEGQGIVYDTTLGYFKVANLPGAGSGDDIKIDTGGTIVNVTNPILISADSLHGDTAYFTEYSTTNADSIRGVLIDTSGQQNEMIIAKSSSGWTVQYPSFRDSSDVYGASQTSIVKTYHVANSLGRAPSEELVAFKRVFSIAVRCTVTSTVDGATYYDSLRNAAGGVWSSVFYAPLSATPSQVASNLVDSINANTGWGATNNGNGAYTITGVQEATSLHFDSHQDSTWSVTSDKLSVSAPGPGVSYWSDLLLTSTDTTGFPAKLKVLENDGDTANIGTSLYRITDGTKYIEIDPPYVKTNNGTNTYQYGVDASADKWEITDLNGTPENILRVYQGTDTTYLSAGASNGIFAFLDSIVLSGGLRLDDDTSIATEGEAAIIAGDSARKAAGDSILNLDSTNISAQGIATSDLLDSLITGIKLSTTVWDSIRVGYTGGAGSFWDTANGGPDSTRLVQTNSTDTLLYVDADTTNDSVKIHSDYTMVLKGGTGTPVIDFNQATDLDSTRWDSILTDIRNAGTTDTFFVKESTATVSGWKTTGDTIFIDTTGGSGSSVWANQSGLNDTSTVLVRNDTVISVRASNESTFVSPEDNTTLVVGDAGLTVTDSLEVASRFRILVGTDTLSFPRTTGTSGQLLAWDPTADSMYWANDSVGGGSGTTDSTRLGNGLAIRTSAQDSIAAPTDTLEADTTVVATKGHAENYADSTIGDSLANYSTTTASDSKYIDTGLADLFGQRLSRAYFDTTTAQTDPNDSLTVKYADSSDISLFNTDDLTEGATNKYDQPLLDSANWTTGYTIANALDSFSRLPKVRTYFDTTTGVGTDSLKVKFSDDVDTTGTQIAAALADRIDSFFVKETTTTVSGWKHTGDTVFVDTATTGGGGGGSLWDTAAGGPDSTRLVQGNSTDTLVYIDADTTNDSVKIHSDYTMVLGGAGMTTADSLQLAGAILRFGSATSTTAFDSLLVDSIVTAKGRFSPKPQEILNLTGPIYGNHGTTDYSYLFPNYWTSATVTYLLRDSTNVGTSGDLDTCFIPVPIRRAGTIDSLQIRYKTNYTADTTKIALVGIVENEVVTDTTTAALASTTLTTATLNLVETCATGDRVFIKLAFEYNSGVGYAGSKYIDVAWINVFYTPD